MPAEEHVLVVNRAVLEQAGVFYGLTFEVDRYLRKLFAAGVPSFKRRGAMETDPTFKQLIPYVLVTCGERYLTYVRGKRAGETRLVGQRSIGIGGHINPADELPLLSSNMFETYLTAVAREVAEEVAIDCPHTDRIVALLNDDSTEVGRVHLGIVHLWTLESPAVTRREQMITQLEFLTLEGLRAMRESMETWSQFCLDALTQVTGRARQRDDGADSVLGNQP